MVRLFQIAPPVGRLVFSVGAGFVLDVSLIGGWIYLWLHQCKTEGSPELHGPRLAWWMVILIVALNDFAGFYFAQYLLPGISLLCALTGYGSSWFFIHPLVFSLIISVFEWMLLWFTLRTFPAFKGGVKRYMWTALYGVVYLGNFIGLEIVYWFQFLLPYF